MILYGYGPKYVQIAYPKHEWNTNNDQQSVQSRKKKGNQKCIDL